MERCNGCEYEYDGMCTAIGEECKEIRICTVITNKVREEVSKAPIIGKEETNMKKKEYTIGTVEQTEQTEQDNINPNHYKERTSIECIDAMIMTFGAKRTAEYCVQNVYKYVWRHKYKNRLEDLKKAEWYLDKFDELVNRCETKSTADGVVEKRYIEIGIALRDMVKAGREEYTHGKSN